MNDRDIISAFENISAYADSGCVEKKVRNKMKEMNTKTTHGSLKATALAAAIILAVIAIPVAAFGSVFLYSVITTENGYEIAVDGNFTPIEFSREMEEELKQYRIVMTDSGYSKSIYETGKHFSDYNEAALWLDCGMLNSEMLGGTTNQDVILSTLLNANGSLHNILVTGNAYLGDTRHYVSINVEIPQKYYDYAMGWKYNGSDAESEESYTTDSGINVQLVITSFDAARAHFIKDGIKYSFTMYKSNFGGNMDECIEMLKTLVDSLE